MRKVKLFIVTSWALALTASSGLAQDWPQWRGPARDGKTESFKAPSTWPKELKQNWKVTVGEGVATPALVGEKLYVFARTEGAETISCLDAATGKELWKDKYDSLGASGSSSGFSGPRASPTVADGKVVTLGIRGVLSCLNAADGKVIWRKDDFKNATPKFYTSSSPLIANGLCVAEVGGGEKPGGIVAYDLASGNEKWKWTGDSPAYGSPVLMTVDGTKLVVALTDTKIVALTAADGKQVWETPFAVQGRGYNAASPIVDGQTLIYAGSGRGVTAVKLGKKGDSIAASELWKNTDNSVMFNTPVLKNGLIFGLSAGNDFFCINAKDGKTAWTAPSTRAAANAAGEGSGGGGGGGRRGGMGRGGFGTIVDAGPVLLGLTPTSELIAFQPTDKAYTEVARIKVADTPTYASPVPSGNRLFVKDQDAVTLWAVQ
jgi:outer membrane protein assembly factor BamB